MKKKISRYFILLGFSLLIPAVTITAQQQETPPPPAESQIEIVDENAALKLPLYRGSSINVDVFQAGSYVLGGNFLAADVGFDVNLKNRFFPIVELGYGMTDAVDDFNDDDKKMHYKSSGMYGRIGMNYNTMGKRNSPSFLYVGFRYAFATMKYDVWGPPMPDDQFGGELDFSYYDQKSNAHWLEFLVGIKVQIYKDFLMGWSFRYRARLSVDETDTTSPWYIPGFGKNGGTNFGFTYNLIYNLPF